MAKYSRSDLIADVWTANQGVTKGQVEMILKTAFNLVADAVRLGNTVELREFATFKPVERAAKVGRNPQTGEPVQIPARTVCAVKAKFKMQPGE